MVDPVDPVERMRRFVLKQRAQQDQTAESLEVWKKKVPELAKKALAVADVLRETPKNELIFAEARSDQILVYFGDRPKHYSAGAEVMIGQTVPMENGAMATFYCQGDQGVVIGCRLPFYLDDRPALEPYCNLGRPEELTNEAFGHAVADFLEWASVGAGRGSKKLHF